MLLSRGTGTAYHAGQRKHLCNLTVTVKLPVPVVWWSDVSITDSSTATTSLQESVPAELKHINKRRKRKQKRFP